MAKGLVQTMIDELSGEEMFPFFALDFTDGTDDYKYTTLDVPITLKNVDFDNNPNIIVDDWGLDAKEFSDWSFNNSSRTSNSTTAPDGTNTGVKLTEDNTVAIYHRFNNGCEPIIDDTTYTWSIFVKAGDKNRCTFRVVENSPWTDDLELRVDMDAGTISDISSGDTILEASSITPYPNDWYLVIITGQFGSASSNEHLIIINLTETNSSWTTTYDGDNSSYIYVWGAQMTQTSSYKYSLNDGPYESRGFEFESINYTLSNVMDDCTLRIDNLDSVLTSIFVGGNVEEKTASVYLGLINTASGGILGTVLMFTGEVDSFEIDETELRLVIGSIFTRWSQQAFSKHSSSCRWKVFKGTKCGYSGTENECDKSYTRCLSLSNSANFGGFRWLPSIENKKIWWGPLPYQRQIEG